jgi:predicted metal-binding transcription factor (methanogenesis marker protein 9)
MYDDTMDTIEIPLEEYEDLKDKLSDYVELLEQLATAYEGLSIDLVDQGEIDLDEILENCQRIYNEQVG